MVACSQVMVACFLSAALVNVIDFIFQAGLVSTTDWISTWPVMQADVDQQHDGGFGPLQALEISYVVANSRTVWLFALDDLLLGLGLAMSAHLAFSSRLLSSRWAYVGAVGAVAAFIGFILNVLRVVPHSWRTFQNPAAAVTGLLHGVIFPVWILGLGWLLRGISAAGGVASRILESGKGGGSGSSPDQTSVQQDPATPQPRSEVEMARGVV